MILTVLLSTVSLASTSVAPPPTPSPNVVLRSPLRDTASDSRRCFNAKGQQAKDKSSAKMKNLGELPPGDLYLTVVRHVDHCGLSTIIRYGIGGNNERPARR